jgi:hypothetical protein
MYPIQIEEYEDERYGTLYELTEFDEERLRELDRHLTFSAVPLSRDFKELHRLLKRKLASLDIPQAS